MRIYVIYGQGGILTSFGMYLLSNRIRAAYPKAVVTNWSWSSGNEIMSDIAANPKDKIILIGYSLGANCVTWVTSKLLRTIDLAVCYDPSRLTTVTQPGKNIKRLLLYHNNNIEPEGHAVYKGPMVETTEISMFHLAICWDKALHDKTMAAIALVR